MGGVRGFGGNVPGILEFAAAMSESIQKQLGGELPSQNNGNGMGGDMGRGGAPSVDGGRRPDQQRPDGHVERAPLEGGERQPAKPGGGMMPPEGLEGGGWQPGLGGGMMPLENLDMAAMETLRQEIIEAGGLTAEIREKAKELGIPERMIAMLEDGGYGMMPGNFPPGEGVGDNHRLLGRGAQQNLLHDKTAFIILLVSGVVIVAGIITALLFKRRR